MEREDFEIMKDFMDTVICGLDRLLTAHAFKMGWPEEVDEFQAKLAAYEKKYVAKKKRGMKGNV